jgi:hypothetical protein
MGKNRKERSMTTFLMLTLVVLAGGDPETPPEPRKPNPFAPSLPSLTKEEEANLDSIIDRFILVDTGRLGGNEGRQALRDFEKLGPEAIPALIRGLNRSAKIEHSCPAVTIAKKLNRMLLASNDKDLLEYARDEIGAGVGRSRHQSVLQDLRVNCMVRRNYVLRQAAAGPPSPRTMTNAELAEAAGSVRGPRLESILTELEQRQGKEVLDGLSTAAGSYERKTQQLARDLLDHHLGRQTEAFVKEKLKDDKTEVRRAAIRVVAKMPQLAGSVIDLLTDDVPEVRDEAHQALVSLANREDFGPPKNATKAQREEAQAKWRTWWERRSER